MKKQGLYQTPNKNRFKNTVHEEYGDQFSADYGYLPEQSMHFADGEIVILTGIKNVGRAIARAAALDVSRYIKSERKKLRSDIVNKEQSHFLQSLKTILDKALQDVLDVQGFILRTTEIERPKDTADLIDQKMDFQEIKRVYREMDPHHRTDWLMQRKERIQAMINDVTGIIDDDKLIELRREYAFNEDPSLAEWEKDNIEIYKGIRKLCSEAFGFTERLKIDLKQSQNIDLDDFPASELFQVFPPQNELEMMAQKKVLEKELKATINLQVREAALAKNPSLARELEQQEEARD